MKKLIILFMIFKLSSCVNLIKHSDYNNFYLTFGSCYDNDTLHIEINDSLVVEKIILNSNFSTGTVLNAGISYINEQLIITNNGETIYKMLNVEKFLKITLSNSYRKSTYNLDLRNGKYLIADGCSSEGFKISQFRKPIVVE
ncbi:hypothetical protein [Peijinzhouia sedimentorum]